MFILHCPNLAFCRSSGPAAIVADAALARPITPPSPTLPSSCHPGCGLSLWQLLITGWPGPAALCMTASRPAQVTQREGETERVGERGGWAGQWKTEEQEEEEEEIERDRKGERGRSRGDEWEKRKGERSEKGREVNSGGQQSGLESTD